MKTTTNSIAGQQQNELVHCFRSKQSASETEAPYNLFTVSQYLWQPLTSEVTGCKCSLEATNVPTINISYPGTPRGLHEQLLYGHIPKINISYPGTTG